jgi:hypothetical protein
MVPHEYNDYLLQNEVRVNTLITEQGQLLTMTRGLQDHRPLRVKRAVLSNKSSGAASNVVFQGATEVISQGKLAKSEQSVLKDKPLSKRFIQSKDLIRCESESCKRCPKLGQKRCSRG